MILGSPLPASALKHAWILLFGELSLIKGNHQLLGMDLSPTILFGSTTNTPSPGLLCGINSKNDQHMQKYCKQVVKQCNHYCLDKCMAALMNKFALSDKDINELEAIDQQLTKILLQADKQCCPFSTAPWSPEIQKAYLTHRYWSLLLTMKRTEWDLSTSLQKIASHLDPTLTTWDPTCFFSSHLKQAQKWLKQVWHNAEQHCKHHWMLYWTRHRLQNNENSPRPSSTSSMPNGTDSVMHNFASTQSQKHPENWHLLRLQQKMAKNNCYSNVPNWRLPY